MTSFILRSDARATAKPMTESRQFFTAVLPSLQTAAKITARIAGLIPYKSGVI